METIFEEAPHGVATEAPPLQRRVNCYVVITGILLISVLALGIHNSTITIRLAVAQVNIFQIFFFTTHLISLICKAVLAITRQSYIHSFISERYVSHNGILEND